MSHTIARLSAIAISCVITSVAAVETETWEFHGTLDKHLAPFGAPRSDTFDGTLTLTLLDGGGEQVYLDSNIGGWWLQLPDVTALPEGHFFYSLPTFDQDLHALVSDTFIQVSHGSFPLWVGNAVPFQVAAVPEPATTAMLLSGLCAVGFRLRTSRVRRSGSAPG